MVNRVIDAVADVHLADVAEWAGVSYHTVREWRFGRLHPSPEALRGLAHGVRRHADKLRTLADRLEQQAERRSA